MTDHILHLKCSETIAVKKGGGGGGGAILFFDVQTGVWFTWSGCLKYYVLSKRITAPTTHCTFGILSSHIFALLVGREMSVFGDAQIKVSCCCRYFVTIRIFLIATSVLCYSFIK